MSRRPHPIAGLADGLLNSATALLGLAWAAVEWLWAEAVGDGRYERELLQRRRNQKP